MPRFDVDDRQLKLGADGEGKIYSIYTVTYSATDGSGNKTLVIGMVTVKK